MRQHLKRHQSNQRTNRPPSPSTPTSPTSSPTTKATKGSQLVPDVRDLRGYKEMLDKTEADDRMLAVLWYSPWCKACRAVMPGIRTLAKHHPDVQFVQVPVLPENANLHQGLDVPSVPYLHLYTSEDPRLVEERKMTRKRLSGFKKVLLDYEKGNCSLEQIVTGDDGIERVVWSASDPYQPRRNSAIGIHPTRRNLQEPTTGGMESVATP